MYQRIINHTTSGLCDSSCNICGVYVSSSASHSYSSNCDSFCNICSYDRIEPHTWSSFCDDVCNGCGSKRPSSGAHIYSNSCDTLCNLCLYNRIINHSFSFECDTSCNVCGFIRSISHNFSIAATCTMPRKCSKIGCGATYGGILGHGYGNWINYNSTVHTRSCIKCKIIQKGNHYYGSNKINCAACGRKGPFSTIQSIVIGVYD